MAVQAEFGESASEAGIRQVEVEPTAPISDVSINVSGKHDFFNSLENSCQFSCFWGNTMKCFALESQRESWDKSWLVMYAHISS